MKVLLRHVWDNTKKETVELAGMPAKGDEIHWPDRILRVELPPKWFPMTPTADNIHGHAACLYVQEI